MTALFRCIAFHNPNRTELNNSVAYPYFAIPSLCRRFSALLSFAITMLCETLQYHCPAFLALPRQNISLLRPYATLINSTPAAPCIATPLRHISEPFRNFAFRGSSSPAHRCSTPNQYFTKLCRDSAIRFRNFASMTSPVHRLTYLCLYHTMHSHSHASLHFADTSLWNANTFLHNADTSLCATKAKLCAAMPSLFFASLYTAERCPCYAALCPALPKRRFALVAIPSLALFCLPSPIPCHTAHSSADTQHCSTKLYLHLASQTLPEPYCAKLCHHCAEHG